MKYDSIFKFYEDFKRNYYPVKAYGELASCKSKKEVIEIVDSLVDSLPEMVFPSDKEDTKNWIETVHKVVCEMDEKDLLKLLKKMYNETYLEMIDECAKSIVSIINDCDDLSIVQGIFIIVSREQDPVLYGYIEKYLQ